MTLEVRIIPDGREQLPADARDHAVLREHLKANEGNLSSSSLAESMSEVEREVTRDYLVLRVDGTSNDWTSSSLDAITNAIVNNLSGVKIHPDGWKEPTEVAP